MKKILTLIFLVSLSASAFGTWTTQHTASLKQLYAIDGVTTAGLARLCAVGNNGYVVLSTDYGTTWTPASGSIPGTPDLRGVAIGADYLYVAGDGECYHSDNFGTSWNDKGTGVPAIIYGVDFSTSQKGVIVGTSGTIGSPPIVMYTANGGSTWTDSTPGTLTMANAVHFESEDEVWIVGASGHVWKSEDGGSSWTQKAMSGGTPITSYALYDVHFYDANHGFIVGANKNFLYTTDGGDTWTLNNSALSSNDNFGVHAVDANTVWVVGETPSPTTSKLTYASDWSAAAEYTGSSSEHLMDVFLTNADNGWVAGYVEPGDVAAYGWITGQITDISIEKIVQTLKSTQTTVYPGFGYPAGADITITGKNFQLGKWPTSSVAFSGSNITTSNVTYVSANELTATIAVDADAIPGNRTVTVTNTDGRTALYTLPVDPLPIVREADPSFLAQGATDQTVVLHSDGGGFQDGLTIDFGSGITVKSKVVNSKFLMTVVIDVSDAAATGPRTITINNPNGSSYASAVFAVSSATATNPTITSVITSVDPDMVERNSTVLVSIFGRNIEFGATVSFSSGDITTGTYTYYADEDRLNVEISVGNSAALGWVTVTVSNLSGGVGNLNRAFSIKEHGITAPRIDTVLPQIVYEGNQNVRLYIEGSDFTEGVAASISPNNGIVIQDVVYLSSRAVYVYINVEAGAKQGTGEDWRDVFLSFPNGTYALAEKKIQVKAEGDTQNPKVVKDTVVVGPRPWNRAVNDTVYIQFELDAPAKVTLPIFGIAGQKQFEIVADCQAGHNSIPWDGRIYTSYVSNGIYRVLLIINGRVAGSTKIVVINR